MAFLHRSGRAHPVMDVHPDVMHDRVDNSVVRSGLGLSTRSCMTGGRGGRRPGGINVSLWLSIGLVLPALYGLALLVAVVVDTWHAGG